MSCSCGCRCSRLGRPDFADPLRAARTGSGSAEAPWSTLEAMPAARPVWPAGDVIAPRTDEYGRPTVTDRTHPVDAHLAHKCGPPSTGNMMRNNLTPTLSVSSDAATVGRHLVSSDVAALDVAVDRFDFHLRSRSPAINPGSDLPAPRQDPDGHPRTAPRDAGGFAAPAARVVIVRGARARARRHARPPRAAPPHFGPTVCGAGRSRRPRVARNGRRNWIRAGGQTSRCCARRKFR